MGWDRPLQGYFLVIEKQFDPPDHYFWSNLEQPVPHPETLTPFLDVLNKLGIQIPQAMIQEIEEDRLLNRGNKNIIHKLTEEHYERIPCQDSETLFRRY